MSKENTTNNVAISLLHFGKVIQGSAMSDEQSERLEEILEYIKSKIDDFDKMPDNLKETIENTIIPKIGKIVAGIIKEQYNSFAFDDKFKLSFDNLITKLNNGKDDIVKDIKTIINEEKGGIDKINERLICNQAQMKNEISFTMDSVVRVEQAVSEVRKDNKITDEAILKLQQLVLGIADKVDLIEQQNIEAAKRNYNLDVLHCSQLDSKTVTAIFEIVKDIKDKNTNTEDLLNAHMEGLKDEILSINDDLNEIKNGNRDIINRICSANKNIVSSIESMEADLKDCKLGISSINAQIKNFLEEGDTDKVKKLKKELAKKEKELTEKEKELGILQSNGAHTNFRCRFCGTKEDRYIINGHCVCSVCGHPFKVDPNMKGISDDKINGDMKEWISDHSAKLEQVSKKISGKKYNLYRMRLENKDTVSNAGVLVIPNKTFDGKLDVSNIAFCQLNTDDKEGKERLSKVKTLIFEEGAEKGLTNAFDGNGNYPFRDIPNLEKVMVWDKKEKGYIVDINLLKKIKPEAVG